MQNAVVQTVSGEITDFLASDPTPEQVVAYHLPEILGNSRSYVVAAQWRRSFDSG